MYRYSVTKDDEDEMYLGFKASSSYVDPSFSKSRGYVVRCIHEVYTSGFKINRMVNTDKHDIEITGLFQYYSNYYGNP